MGAMADYLGRDHRHCDELLAAAEAGATHKDWEKALRDLKRFCDATLRHFAAEEEILFPAFEAASGHADGPTSVMRGEHAEVRALLAMLDAAVASRDADEFLGYAETLNILLQQHNMKEEAMLYPTAERILAQANDELLQAMHQLDAAA